MPPSTPPPPPSSPPSPLWEQDWFWGMSIFVLAIISLCVTVYEGVRRRPDPIHFAANITIHMGIKPNQTGVARDFEARLKSALQACSHEQRRPWQRHKRTVMEDAVKTVSASATMLRDVMEGATSAGKGSGAAFVDYLVAYARAVATRHKGQTSLSGLYDHLLTAAVQNGVGHLPASTASVHYHGIKHGKPPQTGMKHRFGAYTSVSTNKHVARCLSDGWMLVEIHRLGQMAGQHARTSDWSYYPSTEEVLVVPDVEYEVVKHEHGTPGVQHHIVVHCLSSNEVDDDKKAETQQPPQKKLDAKTVKEVAGTLGIDKYKATDAEIEKYIESLKARQIATPGFNLCDHHERLVRVGERPEETTAKAASLEQMKGELTTHSVDGSVLSQMDKAVAKMTPKGEETQNLKSSLRFTRTRATRSTTTSTAITASCGPSGGRRSRARCAAPSPTRPLPQSTPCIAVTRARTTPSVKVIRTASTSSPARARCAASLRVSHKTSGSSR